MIAADPTQDPVDPALDLADPALDPADPVLDPEDPALDPVLDQILPYLHPLGLKLIESTTQVTTRHNYPSIILDRTNYS